MGCSGLPVPVGRWLNEPVVTQPRPGLTPLGAYIERRRQELGFDSEVAFVNHIPRVNGGEGVSRGTIYNWSRDPDTSIQPRKLRLVARALAGDLTDSAYQRELNTLHGLIDRPPVEADELDLDPELVRELGAAGRKFIEAQVRLVVQLRRDVWDERRAADTDKD